MLVRSDYLKLGNLPVQENGTTPTMYGEEVTGGGGGCPVQQEEGTWLEYEILETKHHTLLPLDTCLGVQLLSYEAQSVCMAEATQSLTREAILRDYQDVFSGIGCLPGYMTLSWMTQYLRMAVQEKLQAMEKDGWIGKVDRPTEWLPFQEVTPSESCCHYGKEHQMQRSRRHQ